MATKQRSRSRRPDRTDRGAHYVAPVLDPNWENPYAPSLREREANLQAIRRFVRRRKLPQTLVIGVLAVALVAGVVVAPWLPAVGVVLAGWYAWHLRRSLRRYAQRGRTLGASLLAAFEPAGTPSERERLVTVLDRLAATFGVDSTSAFIVRDSTYNAALVPDGARLALYVTSALMEDFELIELEGVVAHCLARQRLGQLDRAALACVVTVPPELARELAGVGLAYRADEVAAASIRYPLGLAGALHKCARQSVSPTSFFAGERYAQWRWVFFDVASDRQGDLSDLDDAELRARALEEW